MTRGNQREKAREKAGKKGPAKKASDSSANAGKSLTDRKQRDADIMRDKQKKKDEAAAAAGGATGESK